MNKIHNIIWSAAHNAWVVVAEGTKSRSKSGAKALKVMIALLLISPAGAMAASLPQGGVISVGEGSIVSSGNNQLIIKQTTEKLGVNWQSFNVGDDGHVIFDQPGKNSIALNRVIGSDGSAILGKIDANGQVFLINPNGVIFGKGSQVNVGGIVASTLDITDENFKNGNYEFKTGVTNGEVVNHGTLQAAEGGYVALLGKSVKNNGIIKARLGTAALAAGSAVTLDFAGDGLVNIQVTDSAVNALVDNKGLVKADGGNVLMTARASNALTQTVVNNDGIIEAQTLGARGGKIFLDGGQDDGAVRVAGTLDASAPLSGDGGFIETSGKTVKIDDGTVITTKSQQGHSGTWLVDPTDFTISAGSGSQTSSGIGAATLVTALGSGNVTLQTAAGGTENGDINVNADVAWDSDNTLTLTAANSINVNANINIFGSSNGGLVMNFTTPNYFIAKGSAITLSSSGAPTYTENGHAFFLMKSLTDLLQLDNAAKSGGYFALATSLDATATSGWNGGLGYAPALMGSTFQGTINGLGNSINNLSINRPTQDYVGLIGQSTNANISNLSVSGTVAGKGSVGLITGKAAGGVLYNVDSYGSVTGAGSNTGGLVGYLNGGTLKNGYSQSTVSGTYDVGGIVGYAYNNASISTVSSTGNVTSTGSYTGGLAGELSGSTLTNSNFQGAVSGATGVGGVVGFANNSANISTANSTGSVTGTGNYTGGLVGYFTSNSSLTNSYSLGTVSGAGHSGGVVGYSLGNSTISTVYSTGNVTGTGVAGGLVGVLNGSMLTNSYSLSTVSGATSVGGVIGASLANSSISNVYSTGNVTGTDSYTGGLVGQLSGGTLTNGYSQGAVYGISYVGGIVGYVYSNASISTVHSTGSVTGTGNYTGGLVGYFISNSSLNNSYSSGTVSGVTNVGGVIGRGINSTNISSVYSTGNVTGTGSYTGGLVGQLTGGTLTSSYSLGTVFGTTGVGGVVGYANSSASISTVYSTGNVSGTDNYTGGLVGWLDGGTLTNSHSLSTVSGTGNYTGGLVGYFNNNSSLTDSYSSGAVFGTTNVGGVIGRSNSSTNISTVYSTGNVTGTGSYTGGLVGQLTGGTLTSSYSLGTVFGTTGVGGVVGYANSNASISTVYSTGNVSGTDNYTGGLVGWLDGGTLTNSHSLSTVSGTGNYTGGLVGYFNNNSSLTDSYSSGAVFGTTNVGGVIGKSINSLNISTVYSTGNVTGTGSNVGGLAGQLSGGTLTNSYSNSTVSGTNYVGGIVGSGNSSANISNVYSTGNVTGTENFIGGIVGALNSASTLNTSFSTSTITGADDIGGLVGGMDTSTISNAYATGQVSGASAVGGLVGLVNNGQISNVYSTGLVTATGTAGGLIASDTGTNTISEAYWDTTLSGQATSDLGVGYANLTEPLIFSTWDIAHAGGSSNIWRMYDGLTGPLLRVFMGTATAAPGSASTTTYNGQNQSAGDFPVPALTTDTTTGFFQPRANQNTWSFTQNGVAIRNAGSYVVDGWYSTQFGYDITDPVKSTLLINKAALVVTATGVNRVYDGTMTGSLALEDNRFSGDELTLSSTATFSDKNVGTGKAISVTGITVTGADAQNYEWNTTAAPTTADITKATLNISAVGQDKVYDGTTTGVVTLSDNRINGDDLTISADPASFTDKNAGAAKTVNIGGITVTGADAQNYTVNSTATTTAAIDKASLVIKAEDSSKLEGTADGSLSWHLQGGTLFSGDSVSGALARAAGEGVGAYAIDQGDLTAGSNYDLSVVPATFTITQAVTPPVVIPPLVQPTNPQIVALVSAKNIIATVSMSAKTTDHTSNNTSFTEKNNVLMEDIMVNKGMKLPDELIDEKDSDR